MKKILLTSWVPEDCVTKLREKFEVQVPGEAYTTEEMMALLPEFDAVVAISSYKITREMIDRGEKLLAVGNLGVGYDNIAWEYCTEKGIPVINTPVEVQEATSELTIALMLAITRGIVMFDRDLRETLLCPKTTFFDRDMASFGHTLGIVGYGRIGKQVAKKAKAFGMNILYYDDIRASEAEEQAAGVTYVSFEELLRQSDVVTIHVPYLTSTHHLFNRETIAKMRDGAYLVNVARGPIVCESDLVEALTSGKLRGAALDVFEFEPKVGKELAALPNVVITPHVGTNTTEVRLRMLAEVLQGVEMVLDGTRPPNVANPSIYR